MHSYSINSTEHRHTPFFIAVTAILTTFLVFHFLDVYKITPPWWATTPIDTMTFFGLFYWLFDQYMWKWPLLRQLHIIKTPNLNGEWFGYVYPTLANGVSAGLQIKTEMKITIKQTWTKLLIIGNTGQSKFHSLSASLRINNENRISYEYFNEPFANAASTMHGHNGTARLAINELTTKLEGEYYSGRDRQNFGSIILNKKKLVEHY